MTLRIACAVIGLALSAGAVEAAHFSNGKLPKPIDYPIVRPKLGEGHKIKPKLRYNNPYERTSWGSQWKLIFSHPARSLHHSLR